MQNNGNEAKRHQEREQARQTLIAICNGCSEFMSKNRGEVNIVDDLRAATKPFDSDEFVRMVLDQMHVSELLMMAGASPQVVLIAFLMMGRSIERKAQELKFNQED